MRILVNDQKVNCPKCKWSDKFERFVPHLKTHICQNCQPLIEKLENDNKLLNQENMALKNKIDRLIKENSILTE